MQVRILAFFDTRYQTSPDLSRLFGTQYPWDSLRRTKMISRQHAQLNWPSSLGTYDLTNPEQAAQVVGMAAQAGLDGFIVDLHPFDGRYVSGAEPLIPLCRPEVFGLAFRWQIGTDAFWQNPADEQARRVRAASLLTALPIGPLVLADGRPILMIDQPERLTAPAQTLAILREAAVKVGLPGLYLIASQPNDKMAREQGFDGTIDPSPGEWASCQPQNRASGLDIMEIEAGLRDSVEGTDRFYPYAPFVVGRMTARETRGKVFPRVFPAFQNWPSHLEGGATVLTNRDGTSDIDPALYGSFIENAISFAQDHFAPDERLVFLESWNHWMDSSQIEPSTLDGDLVYNATRDAIDRGLYLIRTRGERPQRQLADSVHDMISQFCDIRATKN